MGYKYSFKDNEEYGAPNINAVFSKFTASGVLSGFTNGLPYNLKKINDLVKAVATDGTVPQSKTTLQVTNVVGTNTVKVWPGTAIFSDGSTIEVEGDGEILTFERGKKNYVFLRNDLNLNKNFPMCSTESPGVGDIPLAEIAINGSITDKRKYAKGKIPAYCSTLSMPIEFADNTLVTEWDSITGTTNNPKYNGSRLIPLTDQPDLYNYVIVQTPTFPEWEYEGSTWGTYDIKNNLYQCIYYNSSSTLNTTKEYVGYMNGGMTTTYHTAKFTVERKDGALYLRVEVTKRYPEISYPIQIIVI